MEWTRSQNFDSSNDGFNGKKTSEFTHSTMITFQQYLDENGLHKLSKEERKRAHKEFRTIYQREYRKLNHRKKKRRVEIHFEATEYEALEVMAKEHDLSVPGFLRASYESYENQTYILRDKETMASIEAALRQCAGNLTKIAFEVRRSGAIPLLEIEKLQDEIKDLRRKISHALVHPPTAKEFLLQQQDVNPQFLSRLQGVLENLLKTKQ